jgi:prepilin peptidase CpaA
MIWWVNFVVLALAAGIDIRTRRIPNWLTLPFLASGLVFQAFNGGWGGVGHSLAGIGLALVFFGIPCFLGGMGMGDLKLGAGVAVWIGPGQALLAFIVTGVAGGIMAVFFALRHRSLQSSLDAASDLLFSARPKGASGSAAARLSIPYGPAIATGALFSFFAR